MLDLTSSIGSGPMIIDFKDVVSAIGYNISCYLKGQKSSKFIGRSNEELLTEYVNRDTEDIEDWFKAKYDIKLNVSRLMHNEIIVKPTFLFPYKLVEAAEKEKKQDIYIYNEISTPAINNILKTFESDHLKLLTGDFVEIIDKNPNCTFTTGSLKRVRQAQMTHAPFVLVIDVDYCLLLNEINSNNSLIDTLEAHNVYIEFYEIFKAGIIK